MNEPVYITTPVGRLVQGDAFVGSDKDMQGRPRLTQAGQPKMQWFIGVAFPKGPEWDAMWLQIAQTAQRDFPGGEYNMPGFAWKVLDGDAPANAGKEGLPGHFLLRMSTQFAPQVFNNPPPVNGVAQEPQQIVDPAQCQKGYYVRVQFSTRGNGEPATGKPGVYISHSMIQVVGYGAVIQSGPSAGEVFGAPVALPPGASATPLAPVAGMPAHMGAPAPAPVYAPAPAPAAPVYAPAPAPAPAPAGLPPGVAPNPGFVQPPQ